MKKCKWSKNGSKMLIDSGWKEFDRQTNVIATGNVYATTQFSSFIRPWKETECNGFTNPEGHLMDFDMKPFRTFRIPRMIEDILVDKERERSVILYMFFTRNKEGRTEPFCWVVTDYGHKLIKYQIVVYGNQNHMKRQQAAHEAMSYITA